MPDQKPRTSPDWDPEDIERLVDLLTPLPEAEREGRIEEECADRPALMEEVRSLLEHAAAADRFLRDLQGHVPGPLTGPGAEWTPVGDELAPGSRIGRYRVVERIGSGGMGTVFRAHDDTLNRDVAVKLVSRHLATIPWVYDRFVGEARAAATLDHPNVCTIHEIGESEDGRPFIAMPCYDGETLRARLDRGPVPRGEAVDIALAVVRGLAAAHARGVVHRDIKPSNVMLPPDAPPKILDFGIAKLADATLTDGGHTPGTAAYMSPEQVRGADTDGRTDLWSAGVVLHEMLVGRRPFQGDDDRDITDAILHDARPALSGDDGVPSGLAAVVDRLLRKDPEHRHESADALLRDLERVRAGTHPDPDLAANGAGAGSSPGEPGRLTSRGGRRVLRGAAAAAALLVGALAVAAAYSGGAGDASEPADRSVVAVLPFGVFSAEPSLQYLSEGMLDLLAARLGNAPDLRVVEPGDVVDAVQRAGAPAGHLPSRGARDLVTAWLGANTLVTGQVVSMGDRVTLSAALYEGATGPPTRVTAEGPVDSLPALVDRLTVQLLTLMSGEADRIASVTTSSLPALREFLTGSALYRRGQSDTAAHHLAAAVELDSTFALAALMTFRAAVLGRPVPVPDRTYLELANRHRDRLGAVDRLYLDALLGPEHPDRSTPAQMLAARQRLVASRPDDAEAWFRLAEGMPHQLPRAGVDPTTAIVSTGEVFRRSLALDTSFLPALGQLVLTETALGDTARAFPLARRYLSRVPDGLMAETMRCGMAGASGGYDSLASHVDELDPAALGRCMFDLHFFHPSASAARDSLAAYLDRRSTDPEVVIRALPLMSAVSFDRGRPAEAEDYASIWLQTGQGSPLNDATTAVRDALHWEGLAGAAGEGAAYLERWWGAGPEAEQDAPEPGRIGALCALGQWRIANGRPGTAAPLARALRDLGGEGRSRLDVGALHCAALLDAWSAFDMDLDDVDERVAELDRMLAEGMGWPRLLRETGFVLARIREARGDLAGARDALDRSFITSRQYYTSTFRREQGRLAAAAGDTAAAVDAYRRYLAMRTDPEPALRPEVERVRRELERLVGGAPETRR